jgi:hypothetical protein
MSALSANLSRSTFTQGANFVQSNDLVYRTAIELTGFDAPVYFSARNEYEKKEKLTEITISSTMGFLFAPLYVLGLNKLLSKAMLKDNQAFFQLNWASLDPNNQQKAINQLEKRLAQTENRLHQPNWFDKLGFIKNGLSTHKTQITDALSLIRHGDGTTALKTAYQAKRAVLLADLLIGSFTLSMMGPAKNWVSKHFSHQDRFTGSQTYLSDDDLKKLVQQPTQHDETRQKTVHCLLAASPALLALGTHLWTRHELLAGKQPPKLLMTVRNAMDYTNGIYLMLGGMFSLFLAKNLNLLNWSRDQYECLETAVKYAFVMPTFWMGDHVFNGTIAKLTDAVLSKSKQFDPYTFVEKSKRSWVGAQSKYIQTVMTEVHTTSNDTKKATLAGTVSTGIFLSGFVTHAIATAVILKNVNALTKRWIKKDLSTLQSKQPSLAATPQPTTYCYGEEE